MFGRCFVCVTQSFAFAGWCDSMRQQEESPDGFGGPSLREADEDLDSEPFSQARVGSVCKDMAAPGQQPVE